MDMNNESVLITILSLLATAVTLMTTLFRARAAVRYTKALPIQRKHETGGK